MRQVIPLVWGATYARVMIVEIVCLLPSGCCSGASALCVSESYECETGARHARIRLPSHSYQIRWVWGKLRYECEGNRMRARRAPSLVHSCATCRATNETCVRDMVESCVNEVWWWWPCQWLIDEWYQVWYECVIWMRDLWVRSFSQDWMSLLSVKTKENVYHTLETVSLMYTSCIDYVIISLISMSYLTYVTYMHESCGWVMWQIGDLMTMGPVESCHWLMHESCPA